MTTSIVGRASDGAVNRWSLAYGAYWPAAAFPARAASRRFWRSAFPVWMAPDLAARSSAENAWESEASTVAVSPAATASRTWRVAVRADGARTLVSFDIKDDHSPIQQLEYSLDGEDWTAVFPADGIADSRSEHYELALEGRIPARGAVLRAIDAMNNVATSQVDAPAAR